MKEHFQQRIDDTRQAYLDALNRLKEGIPIHKNLVGKPINITATTIALEAGKSRNPLYHTHKDILDMIHLVKTEEKKQENKTKETSEVENLKQRVKELEEDNKKLLNVNATLLNRNRMA